MLDNVKVLNAVKAEVEQSPPLLRLSIAMAQPLRSYELRIPIPMLTESFNGHALYMLHRLDNEQYQHARQHVQDWLDCVRESLQLTQDDPLDFVQSIPLLQSLRADPDSTLEAIEQATSATQHCYRIHLFLCAMETRQISVELGEELLAPLILQMQQYYESWAAYAQALQQGKWLYVRKNLVGQTTQVIHFRDLLKSSLSPWAMTDIQLRWQLPQAKPIEPI